MTRKNDKNILLTGVFGPFAQDDEYGSRKINPMELYQNQVTRVQGAYSLRMFHRTFALLMIQANIDAPCTVLDFPSLDRFTHEIKANSYEIVVISSIAPNIEKVRRMCKLIRTYQPNAMIIVGGHIASIENLHEMIDADQIVPHSFFDRLQGRLCFSQFRFVCGHQLGMDEPLLLGGDRAYGCLQDRLV